ncbi:MAG: DNA-protecting protein DprA [Bacteroidetes bacterium]|nr:DNA-protecting protein DprA [Bacteroidota bacterium]
MNPIELYYRLALSQVSGIGPIRYKKLIAHFETAEQVFKQRPKTLKKCGIISESMAEAILQFAAYPLVDAELKYVQQNRIQIHCFDDESYPNRLKSCVDSPPILFQRGAANLNHPRLVSVIGTRSYTDYGRKMCEDLIEQLKPFNVQVASGLAYGIDIIAHKNCLKHHIPTIGVVAHGLKTVYPAAHSTIAREMLEEGALLSEYFSNAKLEKGNFPSRNRIVAGMSDATIVVETDVRGGSMITAEIAYSYNRDVFCFPGRSIDVKSAGCNFLIRKLKAQMITNANDLLQEMGWKQTTTPKPIQRELFIEMSDDEKKIVTILREKQQLAIDELLHLSNLHSSQMAASMLNLEMQHIIQVMPGKIIKLAN